MPAVRLDLRSICTWFAAFCARNGGILRLVALLGMCPAGALGQGGGAPVPVKAAPVVQRKVAAGQAFVGTVTPVRRSTVGSAVAGRIVKFTHNEGDYVEEGEVLAQVLTGTIEIELAQA